MTSTNLPELGFFNPHRFLDLLQMDNKPRSSYNRVEYIMGRTVRALIGSSSSVIVFIYLRTMQEENNAQLGRLRENPVFIRRQNSYKEIRKLPEIDSAARISDWVSLNQVARCLSGGSAIPQNTPFVDEKGELLEEQWLYALYCDNRGADKQAVIRQRDSIHGWLSKCLKQLECVLDALLEEQNQRLSLKIKESLVVSSSTPRLSLTQLAKGVIVKMSRLRDIILLEKNIGPSAKGTNRDLEGTLVHHMCETYNLDRKKKEGGVEKNFEPSSSLSLNEDPSLSSSSSLPSLDSPQERLFQLKVTIGKSSHDLFQSRVLESSSSFESDSPEKMERNCLNELISLYGTIQGAVAARWRLLDFLLETLGLPRQSKQDSSLKLTIGDATYKKFRDRFNTIFHFWNQLKSDESKILFCEPIYEEMRSAIQSYFTAMRGLEIDLQNVNKMGRHIAVLRSPVTSPRSSETSPHSPMRMPKSSEMRSSDLYFLLSGFGSLLNLMIQSQKNAAGPLAYIEPTSSVPVSSFSPTTSPRSPKVPGAQRFHPTKRGDRDRLRSNSLTNS